ncbi:D-glycero-alpha-D-manno-heptose-1,7-bisphosphate 7-phosphatase [Streptomyces sp. NPDC051636]|uniref:D-glycero-alpha-D-manno-heptose-1,7-bisphosphate 7-phosphatase n=1 Tax=Streptomyces sp. NPDC051636 TaxID=3365663 RepID=UPI0037B72E9D
MNAGTARHSPGEHAVIERTVHATAGEHTPRAWSADPAVLEDPAAVEDPVHPRPPGHTSVAAVLFDRDGTLVEDVPYNGDPGRVRLLPGAREAVALLRAAGIPTGVVSNQSGIGRGLLTDADVRRVNDRADALLGGLGTWVYCPHPPEAGCACRKPRPGLVLEAARRLGVDPRECAVIGDIEGDVLAARAAGAQGVLVPNAATRPEEVAAAPSTATDVLTAVRRILTAGKRGDRP